MNDATIRACNQCGRCCAETPCPVALAHIKNAKHDEKCPALERHGNTYLCGLFLNGRDYIDFSWMEPLKNEIEPEKLDAMIEKQIQSVANWVSGAFRNECDSIYGIGPQDRRIPLHELIITTTPV